MKVLFARIGSIGDTLFGLPALEDMKRARPDITIDWLVDEQFRNIIEDYPGIHGIRTIPLRHLKENVSFLPAMARWLGYWQEARSWDYDLFIDSQDKLKLAVVGRLSGAKRVAGLSRRYSSDRANQLFITESHDIPERNVIERTRKLCAAALGYEVTGPPRITFDMDCLPQPSFTPPDGAVYCFHFTRRAGKMWPNAHWISLGKVLVREGLTPVFPFGWETERPQAEVLVSQVAGSLLAPALPLMSWPCLLKRAELVVGLDTGLSHMAALMGVPTLQLYCDSPTWWTAPYWDGVAEYVGEEWISPGVDLVIERSLSLWNRSKAARKVS